MAPQIDEILNLYKSGEADIEQAVQWVGTHIDQAAQATVMRDHFASTATLAVDSDGTVPIGHAMTVMNEKPPTASGSDSPAKRLEVLQWWHTAEARIRYLKADALMVARKI